jgi:protein phosphatase
MGGARAGEVASRIALEVFDEQPDRGTPEDKLRGVALEANRRIYEMAQSDTERAGMGTTLTAAIVSGREIAVGHVGDSRMYRLRDGKLERLTEDHSLVEELVRQGRLSPEEAENHPQRSIITRALGPEPEVEVETFTYGARDGDVYLICSDGLSGMVGEQDIGSIIGSASSLNAAARELVGAANRNGGKDNITVVLFRIESDGKGDEGPDTLAGQETGGEVSTEAVREAAQEEPEEAGTVAIGAADAEGARAAELPARVKAVPPDRRPGVRVLPPERGRTRRVPRRARPAIAGAVVLIAAAAAAVGLYVGSRQFYFLGTNNRGVVTLYRGLPYDLPFGIHLYTEEYASSVPALSITDRRVRSHLLNHQLRSRSDAFLRMRELERSGAPR